MNNIGSHNLDYEEWTLRKETEHKLKNKLIDKIQKEMHIEMINTMESALVS